MSPRTNATISPDRAAGYPDLIVGMVALVQSRSSSRAKRRQEEADTHDGNGPAAKVARLASAMTDEETKGQGEDEAPETPLTTERIMNLLDDLWSDDKCVIERALYEIADIGFRDASPSYEYEDKIRMLGGHTAVFQVLKKHVDCLGIQEQGMRALGNLSMLLPTTTLLGEIGFVEVILASMEKYPKIETVQQYGISVIGNLVDGMKCNAERFEKSGGIAVVIAAMKAHRKSEVLQNDCCVALYRMSKWEEHRPLILEAGGVSAIAFVVDKYRDKAPFVSQLACITMRLLVTE
jgi:hypothetical protein